MVLRIFSVPFLFAWATLVTEASFVTPQAGRGMAVLPRERRLAVRLTGDNHSDSDNTTAVHLAWYDVAGAIREGLIGLGSEFLEHAEDRFEDYLADRFGDCVENTADGVGEHLEKGADRVGERLENAADQFEKAADRLGERLGERLEKAADRLGASLLAPFVKLGQFIYGGFALIYFSALFAILKPPMQSFWTGYPAWFRAGTVRVGTFVAACGALTGSVMSVVCTMRLFLDWIRDTFGRAQTPKPPPDGGDTNAAD